MRRKRLRRRRDPHGRHPRPARRRRHGRPQLVSAAREHAVRVPGDLLPARHRGGRHRPRLGGRRFPSRRLRRAQGLPLPRPGRGVDLRRPPHLLPVGDRRRSPRRTLAQAPGPGRRNSPTCRARSTSSRWRRATGSSSRRPAPVAGAIRCCGRWRPCAWTPRGDSCRPRPRRAATASSSSPTTAATASTRRPPRCFGASARGPRCRSSISAPARMHTRPRWRIPEIPPLGPEQAIAPRPIDAGLLDSRE